MTPFLAIVGVAAGFASSSFVQEKAARATGPAIGHMVYFKLKDSTPANRQKLVDGCKKHLESHEGVMFFAAGVISDDFKREVNDRDWDVALHLVFTNKAAHDKYQDHPEHVKFIEGYKEMWAKVRVFDSEFTPTTTSTKPAVVPPATIIK